MNFESSSGDRTLEQTPTWAVATVCFVFVAVSICIEHMFHLTGKWLKKKHKKALYESLEKIKSELMLLGFISLLTSVCQILISNICIPESAANTWHPCSKKEEHNDNQKYESHYQTIKHMRLLVALASAETNKCAKGYVPFMSRKGLHQLHIFIFILAVSHVLYCILTMALGGLKMREWKKWEKETRSLEYQIANDPQRFRFARDTTFGKRHLNKWSNIPILTWIVCFFRQFVRSVPKVDYLTIRNGFIQAHLGNKTKFDFHRYIKWSLEEDFKVVVAISPTIWFLSILFILFNTHGIYSYLWLPFIPLIVVLVVGTKLQVIITRMAQKIHERRIIKGTPIVEPSDNLFWFGRPRLLLYLINFVLFQNAFQIAFFVWTWHEFRLTSCFNRHFDKIVLRVAMGLLIQFLCSYVTLPLYALVIQMGSTMKPAVLDERVASAVKNWHKSAKKNIKLQQKNKPQLIKTPAKGIPNSGSHDVVSPLTSSCVNTSLEMSNFSDYSSQHFQGDGSNAKQVQHNGSKQANLEGEARDKHADAPVDYVINVDIDSKNVPSDKRANL